MVRNLELIKSILINMIKLCALKLANICHFIYVNLNGQISCILNLNS